MTPFLGLRRVISGLSRPPGTFQTHSSLRTHLHRPFAHHTQIAQRKQRHQIDSLIGQSPVLEIDVAELPLDNPKRVIYFGPDAGLCLLRFLQEGAHGRALVNGLTLARNHCLVPVHVWKPALDFFTHVCTKVTRVGKVIDFFPAQQRMGLRDVMGAG